MDELSQQLTTITDEKDRLSTQLLQETAKAVDAQDMLFDTQQALKLKQKELSLMIWKLAAGAYAMKAATEKTIKEMESKKVKQDDGSKLRLQQNLHNMTLTVLHLGRQFVLSNDLRKRMDESLRSYRVDDLNDKRRRIKLLERDIERFNEEAEEIHEQRKYFVIAVTNIKPSLIKFLQHLNLPYLVCILALIHPNSPVIHFDHCNLTNQVVMWRKKFLDWKPKYILLKSNYVHTVNRLPPPMVSYWNTYSDNRPNCVNPMTSLLSYLLALAFPLPL